MIINSTTYDFSLEDGEFHSDYHVTMCGSMINRSTNQQIPAIFVNQKYQGNIIQYTMVLKKNDGSYNSDTSFMYCHQHPGYILADTGKPTGNFIVSVTNIEQLVVLSSYGMTVQRIYSRIQLGDPGYFTKNMDRLNDGRFVIGYKQISGNYGILLMDFSSNTFSYIRIKDGANYISLSDLAIVRASAIYAQATINLNNLGINRIVFMAINTTSLGIDKAFYHNTDAFVNGTRLFFYQSNIGNFFSCREIYSSNTPTIQIFQYTFKNPNTGFSTTSRNNIYKSNAFLYHKCKNMQFSNYSMFGVLMRYDDGSNQYDSLKDYAVTWVASLSVQYQTNLQDIYQVETGYQNSRLEIDQITTDINYCGQTTQTYFYIEKTTLTYSQSSNSVGMTAADNFTYYIGWGMVSWQMINYTMTFNNQACTDTIWTYSATFKNGSSLPSFITYGSLNNTLYVNTSSNAHVGTFIITLSWAQVLGPTYTYDITLNIKDNTSPPQFDTDLVAQTVNMYQSTSYTLPSISDVDGNTRQTTISTLPTFVTIDANKQVFTISPTLNSQAGTHSVTITLSDYSLSKTYTLNITVNPNTGAPYFQQNITDLDIQDFYVGDLSYYQLPDIIDDDSNTCQLEITNALPTFITFNSVDNKFTINPTISGYIDTNNDTTNNIDNTNTNSTNNEPIPIENIQDSAISLNINQTTTNNDSDSDNTAINNTQGDSNGFQDFSQNIVTINTPPFIDVIKFKLDPISLEYNQQYRQIYFIPQDAQQDTIFVQLTILKQNTQIQKYETYDENSNLITFDQSSNMLCINSQSSQNISGNKNLLIGFYKVKILLQELQTNELLSSEYSFNLTISDVLKVKEKVRIQFMDTKIFRIASQNTTYLQTSEIQAAQLLQSKSVETAVTTTAYVATFITISLQVLFFNFQLFDMTEIILSQLSLPVSNRSFGSNFDDQGYSTSNILINNFDLFMFMAQSAVMAVLAKMALKYVQKLEKLNKMCTDIVVNFRYNALIRYAVESCMIVTLCALLNIQLLNVETAGEILSSIVAISLIAVYFAMPVLGILFIIKNFKELQSINQSSFEGGESEPQQNPLITKYGSLFEEFNNKSILALLYYPIFMIRRFATAWVIINCRQFPVIQALLHTYIGILFTGYVLVVGQLQQLSL
eukprot:403366812